MPIRTVGGGADGCSSILRPASGCACWKARAKAAVSARRSAAGGTWTIRSAARGEAGPLQAATMHDGDARDATIAPVGGGVPGHGRPDTPGVRASTSMGCPSTLRLDPRLVVDRNMYEH